MHKLLRQKISERFEGPVNSPKDCSLLSDFIFKETSRTISSTTLRRFFGLLVGKSTISAYNLDTLAIYCRHNDYNSFLSANRLIQIKEKPEYNAIYEEISQITQYTLKSIIKKSLTRFNLTIPREDINNKLNSFLDSKYFVYTVIAPGGYGKSIALAHWVKSLDYKNNQCLFCSAAIFYQLLSAKTNLNQSLSLNLRSSDNLFNTFFNKFSDTNKKLIIVVDGMDELNSDSKKINILFDSLLEILNRYSKNYSLKFVLSIREANWSSLISSDFRSLPINKYFIHIKGILDAGYTNVPVLSNDEIRIVIEKVSKNSGSPIIYNIIPWELREMIRIPINLHFFISIFRKKPDLKNITSNILYQEFLKEVIFLSKYAEEKEDLIWKIVELIENQGDGFYIQKNVLKTYYPIHLKREIKYYLAYNSLVTRGLLLERRDENKYGLFTTNLGFRHLNFYYYLSVLNLIRKNQGIDFELFLNVSQSKQESGWINYVTSILFEIAYENNDFDAIENFCELPEDILGSLQVRLSVGASFRNPVLIRDRIIEKFASSQKGQIYFFEQFVDTNYLYNNFVFRIKKYLKYNKTVEAKLFGNSILFTSGFLKMNPEISNKYYKVIKNIQPDNSIYPWPIGRKVTSHILYSYFIKRDNIANLSGFIREYQLIAYQYKNYLSNGLIEFEISIMIALVLIQEYEILRDMLEISFKSYNLDNPKFDIFAILSSNPNSLPMIFLEYSKFKLGISNSENFPIMLEKIINNYISIFEDFIYQIMLKWLLCDYFRIAGDIYKANIYYQSALEISQFAQYDFYTAFLMINNPARDPESIQQAERQISQSGFKLELFKHF